MNDGAEMILSFSKVSGCFSHTSFPEMPLPFISSHTPIFPEFHPDIAHEDGLVCISDALTPELILAAYRHGIFPWYSEDGIFYWFSQHPRAVLLPKNLHLSRSLIKTLRNTHYIVSVNHHFAAVITACAHTPRTGQNGTWIAPEFQAAYTALHHLGHAHSFECWLPDEHGDWLLSGGFYGVQIGSAFYGESMFAWRNNASKIAFACAVPYLAQCGVQLIDCQQDTAHMKRFGSCTLPFDDFRIRLQSANDTPLLHPITRAIVCQKAA